MNNLVFKILSCGKLIDKVKGLFDGPSSYYSLLWNVFQVRILKLKIGLMIDPSDLHKYIRTPASKDCKNRQNFIKFCFRIKSFIEI